MSDHSFPITTPSVGHPRYFLEEKLVPELGTKTTSQNDQFQQAIAVHTPWFDMG